MLRQRVITALVMLAVFLPAMFAATHVPFTALALLLIAAGGWEWGRLNGMGAPGSWTMGAAAALVCGILWAEGYVQRPLVDFALAWAVVGGLWMVGAAWLVFRGPSVWQRIPRALRLVGGVAALTATWLAVSQAKYLGTNYLLSVLLLVWVADIFAYFAGRAFGSKLGEGVFRGKLAPSISPGKSWAGVWGGVFGVLLLAFAWVAGDRYWQFDETSLFSRLYSQSAVWLLIATLGLTGMSVLGDLVESLVKRSAGFKDSSNLLPGHGGVLDRVDALLPVLPLAMALAANVA